MEGRALTPPLAVGSFASPMKKVIASRDAPGAVGPYSQAIAAGGFLFCAGQIPLDPQTGELAGEGIRLQAARSLENLGAVLKANGMGFSHVVKTTVFLIDLADFAAMNEVYAKYFPELPPARSTIQVSALPRGSRIEIEAIAAEEASHD